MLNLTKKKRRKTHQHVQIVFYNTTEADNEPEDSSTWLLMGFVTRYNLHIMSGRGGRRYMEVEGFIYLYVSPLLYANITFSFYCTGKVFAIVFFLFCSWHNWFITLTGRNVFYELEARHMIAIFAMHRLHTGSYYPGPTKGFSQRYSTRKCL